MGQELSNKSRKTVSSSKETDQDQDQDQNGIRIITSSPYRAHTEPLCIANRILNVTDINTYIIGIFMYDCMNENVPNSFHFFQIDRNIHDYDVRSADDIHVPHSRSD